MKKIFIFLTLVFLLTACGNKQEDWFTVDLPHVFSYEGGAVPIRLNFENQPLEVQPLEYNNGSIDDMKTEINGSYVFVTFNSNSNRTQNTNARLIEGLEFNGQTFYWHTGKIKVRFSKDLDKPLALPKEAYTIQGNHIAHIFALFMVKNMWNGQNEMVHLPISGKTPAEIKQSLTELQPIFSENEKRHRDEYLNQHKEFVSLVKKVTAGAKNDRERARKIMDWVFIDYKPFDSTEEAQLEQTFYEPESPMNSIDYFLKTKKGYCRSVAVTVKAMLDAEGIDNKLVLGYVPPGKGHILNSFFDKELNKWTWLDATAGGFDDPYMHRKMIESEFAQ